MEVTISPTSQMEPIGLNSTMQQLQKSVKLKLENME